LDKDTLIDNSRRLPHLFGEADDLVVLEENLLFVKLVRDNDRYTFLYCAESPKFIDFVYSKFQLENSYLNLLTKTDIKNRVTTILEARKIRSLRSAPALQKTKEDIYGFMNFELFYNRKIPPLVIPKFLTFLLKNRVFRRGKEDNQQLVLAERNMLFSGTGTNQQKKVTIEDFSEKSFATVIGRIILATERESDNLTR
jgi:hypothetical protein